jgi:hypothetical protein
MHHASNLPNATCHSSMHSFSCHFLEDGYDIRTAQELPGLSAIKTTMNYTHVPNCGPSGVRIPVHCLYEGGSYADLPKPV